MKRTAIIEGGVVVSVACGEITGGVDVTSISCGPGDLYDGATFRKPDPIPPTTEEINTGIWNRINKIEKDSLFSRQLREFMLEQPGASAKPWYAKVKQVDDDIAALKAQLVQ